jgi:hypothetical protein
MTVEAHKWFVYADENLAVARMALKSGITMPVFKIFSKRLRNS